MLTPNKARNIIDEPEAKNALERNEGVCMVKNEELQARLAFKLRALRAKTGLSQTAFGKYAGGIPLRTIQHWEKGDNGPQEYIVNLIEEKVNRDFPEEEKYNEV